MDSGLLKTAAEQLVLAEPMSADLEAKVLKETGISGAAIGAVGGALVGGLATMGAARAAGASAEEILTPQPEPVVEEVKVEGTDASQPF